MNVNNVESLPHATIAGDQGLLARATLPDPRWAGPLSMPMKSHAIQGVWSPPSRGSQSTHRHVKATKSGVITAVDLHGSAT